MTYKDRFLSSEGKALNKIIATKIDRDMRVLRTSVESSSAAPRRWVWELIQNAKDVHHPNEPVKILIELIDNELEPKVIFKHNGKPFTADNIRFLIEQISSKERKLNDDGKPSTTGKFGTGFLTTHLLSEIVHVKGIAKEPDLEYREFEMTLDRSGNDLDQISDGVERAKASVSNLDDLPCFDNYVVSELNTTFTYPLNDSVSKTVAEKGLEDLKRSLFYVLLFVEDVAEVEICHERLIYKRNENNKYDSGEVKIASITVEDSVTKEVVLEYKIAYTSKNHTQLAIPVSVDNEIITFKPIDEYVPRLFCDFPLIGTESFPFPLIINNPLFNPTDPRDGVFLNDQSRSNDLIDQNKKIIKEAIDLYLIMLEHAAEKDWKNLHVLANIQSLKEDLDWVSQKWHLNEVLGPIRKKLLHAKIVYPAHGEDLVSILSEDNEKYVWFPHSHKGEVRQEIWRLANYWFPHCLPKLSEVDLWYKLSWNECGRLTTKQFSDFIENHETLEKLNTLIKTKRGCDWLNEFYDLIKIESKDYDAIINQSKIFPDQNGILNNRSELSVEKGIIDESFKEILKILGRDIKSELSDTRISSEHIGNKLIDESFVVKEISSYITQKYSDQDKTVEFKDACQKLLKWFKDHPNSAAKYFPDIYRRKHILYDEEVIIENIDKAEQLQDLLDDYGASDLSELKSLIENAKNKTELLPVTQDILSSLGISNIEEWKEAMQDKDIAALFSHKSTPSEDMFLFVQSMISKAKQNIKKKLDSIPEYDLMEMEETAPTVLSGITKNGMPISIVARPAYSGEVILYYGAERDVLDFEDSELWVDDGIKQRAITLGQILKKTGIRKFPI